mmetsp:Transcript_1036/g.1021  ORF Transcript_1036/g.1021 Transcript_1036/m.1021 type:complete len:127 (+) Transcript_1036:425-805(+)
MIYENDMTLPEVMAIPEQDEWEYENMGKSRVCSSLVVSLYKAAGIFGRLNIQATEFTPKDVYQLNIFENDQERPEKCVVADPHIPYCQLMGKYRIYLPGLNSVDPYDHMNEKCPSVPTEYFRPKGC